MTLILAIETSCDETSTAVIKDGSKILSNIVATQVEFHKKYGGIVPEIASRKHIEVINPIIEQALNKAKVKYKDLAAVAVTHGPGLVGSLLVGLCAAKALSFSLNIPLIGINHLEAHIYANFLLQDTCLAGRQAITKIQDTNKHQTSKNKNQTLFPFICLLVSGGHTMIVLVEGHGKYKVLGRTRDDAAGEAFDKVARFIKLGYPGGPIIDKLAKEGNPEAINFPRPMLARRSSKSGGGMEKNFGYDFSFSGIKTAVVNYVNNSSVTVTKPVSSRGNSYEKKDEKRNRITKRASLPHNVADLAASFQQAVVDVLVTKTIRAAKEYNCKTIALAGGVAANSCLRKELTEKGQGLNILVPPLSLCTDNAAMVGCLGYYKLQQSQTSDLKLPPVASLSL